MEASHAVADSVFSSLDRMGKMHKNHVEHANFMVLKSPDVPSILVETAFISNPSEEKKLKDPAWQKKLARTIADLDGKDEIQTEHLAEAINYRSLDRENWGK